MSFVRCSLIEDFSSQNEKKVRLKSAFGFAAFLFVPGSCSLGSCYFISLYVFLFLTKYFHTTLKHATPAALRSESF